MTASPEGRPCTLFPHPSFFSTSQSSFLFLGRYISSTPLPSSLFFACTYCPFSRTFPVSSSPAPFMHNCSYTAFSLIMSTSIPLVITISFPFLAQKSQRRRSQRVCAFPPLLFEEKILLLDLTCRHSPLPPHTRALLPLFFSFHDSMFLLRPSPSHGSERSSPIRQFAGASPVASHHMRSPITSFSPPPLPLADGRSIPEQNRLPPLSGSYSLSSSPMRN